MICSPSLPLSPASLYVFLHSASQPLYLSMLLSHLSITGFQFMSICVASHLLSQSLRPARVDMSPSKSLAVCFCLHPCSFSLCAFLFALWETLKGVFVTSSSHFHGDQPRLTALTEVSSWQGLEKAWRNVRVCKIGSAYVCLWVHFYLWACTRVWAVSGRQFESSFFLWKDYCDAYLADIDK